MCLSRNNWIAHCCDDCKRSAFDFSVGFLCVSLDNKQIFTHRKVCVPNRDIYINRKIGTEKMSEHKMNLWYCVCHKGSKREAKRLHFHQNLTNWSLDVLITKGKEKKRRHKNPMQSNNDQPKNEHFFQKHEKNYGYADGTIAAAQWQSSRHWHC